jgi:hypothetical protein
MEISGRYHSLNIMHGAHRVHTVGFCDATLCTVCTLCAALRTPWPSSALFSPFHLKRHLIRHLHDFAAAVGDSIRGFDRLRALCYTDIRTGEDMQTTGLSSTILASCSAGPVAKDRRVLLRVHPEALCHSDVDHHHSATM